MWGEYIHNLVFICIKWHVHGKSIVTIVKAFFKDIRPQSYTKNDDKLLLSDVSTLRDIAKTMHIHGYSWTQNPTLLSFVDQTWSPNVSPFIWGLNRQIWTPGLIKCGILLWSEVDKIEVSLSFTLNQTVFKFTWAHTTANILRGCSPDTQQAPWETWYMKTLIRLRVQVVQHRPVSAPSPWRNSFAHWWLSVEGQRWHRQHSSAHGHGPLHQTL